MSQKPLVIVGLSPQAEQAAAVAKSLEAGREALVTLLPVERRLKIDFSALEALDAHASEVFIALDDRAVNFSRLEIFSMLKARGFSMARLVAKGAFLDPGHRIGENTIVHVGARISPDARIGYNVVIGPGAVVGQGARIGNSAYLGPGAVIANGAAVGDNTTIAAGVVVDTGVKVGKQGQISIPGVYRSDIPDKTFYAPGYDGPVRIIRF